jgi:hypothetical protein
MSDTEAVRRLTILSADQAWERFGDLTSEGFLHEMKTELSANMHSYRAPQTAEPKEMLARGLAEFSTGLGPGMMCITHWWDEPAEFVEYRRSLNEIRPLIKSPVHLFSGEHCAEVKRLLSFVLELDWDCFVFDREFRYLIEISHDGFISLTASDPSVSERARVHLAAVNLRPFSISEVSLDS